MASVADSVALGARSPDPGWARHTQSLQWCRDIWSKLENGRRALVKRGQGVGDVSWRAVRESGELAVQESSAGMDERRSRVPRRAKVDPRAERKRNGISPNAEGSTMTRSQRGRNAR